MSGDKSIMSNESKYPSITFDNLTPTLFVGFDGTLHRGNGLLSEDGALSLDSGNQPFEFASLLTDLLDPYPNVEIVLTSSWIDRLPLEQLTAHLPDSLARRVVGSTRGYKVRFGCTQDGTAKTYVIRSFVFDNKIKNWLAIDDSLRGTHELSSDLLPLAPHILLLDSNQGIGAIEAQQRIREWLADLLR